MCHFVERRGVNQMVSKLLTFRNITSGGGVTLRDSEDKTKIGPAATASPCLLLTATQDASTSAARKQHISSLEK